MATLLAPAMMALPLIRAVLLLITYLLKASLTVCRALAVALARAVPKSCSASMAELMVIIMTTMIETPMVMGDMVLPWKLRLWR